MKETSRIKRQKAFEITKLKKDIDLVKAESKKLYQEIINNGYEENIAKQISEDMEAKGNYLFNQSHAAAYAVVCFQTAYLKTYYPLYFFKALFNLNKDKAGMLNKYILETKEFGIKVLPPNINKSEMNFSIHDGAILFGLSAIKGIGETLAKQIIDLRGDGYSSMKDFIEKVNPTKAQVIALIKSGAIPASDKKKSLLRYLKSIYTPLTFKPVAKAPSYSSLVNDYDIDIEKYRIGPKKFDYDKEKLLQLYNEIKLKNFEEQEKLRFAKHIEENSKYLKDEEFWEFQSLQIFIGHNPFDKAYEYLPSFEDVAIGDKCAIVGVIAKVQKKKDRHKKQFAFINIYSTFGLIEGIVWHTQFKTYEELIKTGSQIAVLGTKDSEDKVVIEKMKSYDEWLHEKRNEGIEL